MRIPSPERMFVGGLERFYELDALRRSLAMLRPQAAGLDREHAMALIEELQDAEHQLQQLRDGIERVLEEDRATDLGHNQSLTQPLDAET